MPKPSLTVDQLIWSFQTFSELDVPQLYDLLHVRCQVFIAEQVAFQDLDYKDQSAWHLLGRDPQGVLQAYVRVLPPGLPYAEPSIGRVAVMQAMRGTGAGWELMRHAMAETDRLWPGTAIRIGAQAYLQKFYEGCGFEVVSEPYMEDGIPHLTMLYPGETQILESVPR
ncbi:GNAT family N-acetyltransferase [Comamonas piscis]|uniref:GNAT family N-acetyltransferase n=1 Tax=Comamonas piscis TaxID=1562974 RepID=A0A7G5EIQ7_9BURK|nr:GNAT family N-acetyltransferase [Comamonas piscis]QMV73882.1 GNAT family N-acetyltransferase [Comamonas piscis]WSO32305.1 GNAT family N-acetyltransferase [Comamonas piscis]